MPTLNDPNGTAVKVNSEGKLETDSVTERESLHVNEDHQATYSAMVDVTPGSTDDDFFYLKNKDTRELVIYKIEGWCADANQEISVLIGATSPGTDAGDAIVPANMNATSGHVADVDCTQDATDLAIANGTAITLLKFPTTALELASYDFPGGIILPKNQRLHMEAALAGLINLTIYFYFHQ